jgi:hypothetical protein
VTTITIPRGSYTERTDDEGRTYYGYGAVVVAAQAWVGEAANQREFNTIGEDDRDPVAFVSVHDGNGPELTVVHPDEDMDWLYAANDLPFTIKQSPFDVGDRVRLDSGNAVYTVTSIFPDGSLRAHTPTQVLTKFHATEVLRLHRVIDEPKPEPEAASTGSAVRTFVVTVEADMPANEAGILADFLLAAPKCSTITVREAR